MVFTRIPSVPLHSPSLVISTVGYRNRCCSFTKKKIIIFPGRSDVVTCCLERRGAMRLGEWQEKKEERAKVCKKYDCYGDSNTSITSFTFYHFTFREKCSHHSAEKFVHDGYRSGMRTVSDRNQLSIQIQRRPNASIQPEFTIQAPQSTASVFNNSSYSLPSNYCM